MRFSPKLLKVRSKVVTKIYVIESPTEAKRSVRFHGRAERRVEERFVENRT